jgi:hypothetical protein
MADDPSAKVRIRPSNKGLSEIGRSPGMGALSLKVAQKIAGAASARGRSSYVAKNQSVRAGWQNEARAGAVAREVKKDWRDSRDKVLIRVTEQMKVRARR